MLTYNKLAINYNTGRIFRYLAAIDLVDEVSATQYAANNVTRNLTEKSVEAGLCH